MPDSGSYGYSHWFPAHQLAPKTSWGVPGICWRPPPPDSLAWAPGAGQIWAQGVQGARPSLSPLALVQHMPGECTAAQWHVWVRAAAVWQGWARGLAWAPAVCPVGWRIAVIQLCVDSVPEHPHPEYPVRWRWAASWQACETNPGFWPFWKKKGVWDRS